jgi:hypothetical protein
MILHGAIRMKKKRFLFLIILVIGLAGLMALTQRSLKQSLVTLFITEEEEIIKTVEKAYAIETEAGYTFDLSKLSTVFINDSRFPLHSSMLQFVREVTQNPTLKSGGYLDYKMAYYSWRRDATLHAESVYKKAKAENRELTLEEKNLSSIRRDV